MLKINYGVNKYTNGKRIHKTNHLFIEGTEEDWLKNPIFHRKIKDAIQKNNEGWYITGYSLVIGEKKDA